MEYLIGNPDDPRNWGDPKTTRGGIWSPLEKIVSPAYRTQFIFMQRLITEDQVEISTYMHEPTGTMVLVDDEGQNYMWLGYDKGIVPVSVQEARTRLVAALLDAIDMEGSQTAALVGRIRHYRALPRPPSLIARRSRFRNNDRYK